VKGKVEFAKESIERWTSDLAPDTQQADLLIYQAFKTELGLNPYALVVESRKEQDADRIQSSLQRFYEALIVKGLGESTAKQYYSRMHSYFVKNRVLLRKMEQPRPIVPLGNLLGMESEPVDRKEFATAAMNSWLNKKSLEAFRVCHTVLKKFKVETGLDPVDLLLEARRTQDPKPILDVLDHFYDRLIQRGLREQSANQYVIIIREFFLKNGMKLPRIPFARWESKRLVGLDTPQSRTSLGIAIARQSPC
jgi:hypothetical protein